MTVEIKQLSAFLDQLRARVSNRCTAATGEPGDEDATAAYREEGFTHVVLEILEDLGHISGAEVCFFEKSVGKHRVRVNGWQFDEDEGQLDLVTTVFRDAFSSGSIPRADLQKALKQALNVVHAAEQRFHEQLEPASDSFAMLQRMFEVRKKVERVRLIVLADGIASDPGTDGLTLPGLEVRHDVWDHQRLFRAQASGLPYEPIAIDLQEKFGEALPCLPMPHVDVDYQAYLAIIPGRVIQALYHEFGPKLLELNVRSFLMLRGKVNKGIRRTILDAPQRFLAFNNGLSLTAQAVELTKQANGTSAIRAVTGLQVVNGGQTVATIHRAGHVDRADLSKVFVQAKITIVPADHIEVLVPEISRYANTQNKVNDADFSANSAFHVRIQQLSETVWCPGETSRWFYERARGQYHVARAREGNTSARLRAFDARTPPKQTFDKVLLARFVNTWDQLPHIVGKGGQKNFTAFTDRLAKSHSSDWEPDAEYYKRLVAKAILYRTAERCAQKHAFTGYRANAVAYTLALLSWRTAGRVDLLGIWDRQRISPILEAVLDSWMPHVHKALVEAARERNVTEWCKKEECWREIQTLDLGLPRELLDELATGQPLPNVGDLAGQAGVLSDTDRENIARVMQASAERWFEIIQWGSKSGTLNEWQINFAGTMAGYAATGWAKVPSAKQATQGVKILAIADSQGMGGAEEENHL